MIKLKNYIRIVINIFIYSSGEVNNNKNKYN